MPLDTANTERPAHPNKAKMDAAVDRWIAEAGKRADGADLLTAKAEWVEKQLQELSYRAGRDEDPAAHLIGLTAIDLLEGQWKLEAAARSFLIEAAQ